MRDKLKKIVAYIFRGWDKEPGFRHSRLHILPPIFFELFSYIVIIAILYKVGAYLWSLI